MPESKVLISFAGPPGGGKGTQARLLADKLGLPVVVTGDLVRLLIGQKPEIEKLDQATIRKWFEEVRHELLSKGYLRGGCHSTTS